MKDELSRRFEGRKAVVSGGADGMGAATVERLAAEGAEVWAIDVKIDMAKALAERLCSEGRKVHAVRADVTNVDELASAFTAIGDAAGGLDVLVNIAGGSHEGDVSELGAGDWDRYFALNVRSTALACKHAIPLMKTSGGGAVVNMSSISGLKGDPGWGVYNSMKAAIINLTECLAWEVGRDGIRVNAVCPGPIASERMINSLDDAAAMTSKYGAACAVGRLGRPEEVAAAIAFLASDEAGFISGVHLVVDGGLTARTGQPCGFDDRDPLRADATQTKP
ncbi:MAG: SDR family NAD(P)-dependent oxidoreductase [Pseudomonadota bacterium]